MKLLFLLVLLLIASTHLCGQENTKDILFNTLTPFISSNIHEGNKLIAYCPDGLCYIVKAPAFNSWDTMHDYAVLFFILKGEFPEFKEEGYRMPSSRDPHYEFNKLVPLIVQKYRTLCGCDTKNMDAENVLNCLTREYKIHGYFEHLTRP